MPAFTIRDHIKQVQAGGPGSGRRPGYARFELTQNATGNQVHDVAKSLGYSRTNMGSGSDPKYNHPDGHEMTHVSNFHSNYVDVQARGSGSSPQERIANREAHLGNVERAFERKELLE